MDQITNKKDLKEKMTRYEYYLPQAEAFCTMSYLFGVMQKTIYAPKFAAIKLRPCSTPPLKELILGKLRPFWELCAKLSVTRARQFLKPVIYWQCWVRSHRTTSSFKEATNPRQSSGRELLRNPSSACRSISSSTNPGWVAKPSRNPITKPLIYF